jgi:RNA recognition motif-containing protein
MKLFVKNLPFTTMAGELHKIFESYGKVTVELQRHQSGKSRGSAYLTFENEEAATRAMEKNGELLGGRVMKVMKARPPVPREDCDQERKRTRRRDNYSRKPRGDEICFGYPINQQIYVGGIGALDEANVHAIFVPFGDIAQVDIMRNKHTGAPKGYGFVIFDNAQAAKASLEMDGSEIANVKLKVSLARMKNKYPRAGRFHDPMPSPDPINSWSHSYPPGPMNIPNPYEFNQHPYPAPAAADFPNQEDTPIAPMAGGGPFLGPTPTPPPPSEHSDPGNQQTGQVPFYFMNGSMPGYLPAQPDLPGLISGFGNLSVDNQTRYWGPSNPQEEQRDLRK